MFIGCIFPKTDPPLFIGAKPPEASNSKQKMSMELLYLWKTVRLVNSVQQVHPLLLSLLLLSLLFCKRIRFPKSCLQIL